MLRLATADDAQDVLAIYTPIVTATPISFETNAPTLPEMRARIEKTLVRYPWLVWDEAGVRAYAYAGAHRTRLAYDWSVDVTAYVAEAGRRRGLGGKLYRALLELLGLQGFVSAFAGIALPNPASVALHESVGFEPLGVFRDVGYKLGAWRDVGWWQRRLIDPPDPPQPPIALPDLIERSPELVRTALTR